MNLEQWLLDLEAELDSYIIEEYFGIGAKARIKYGTIIFIEGYDPTMLEDGISGFINEMMGNIGGHYSLLPIVQSPHQTLMFTFTCPEGLSVAPKWPTVVNLTIRCPNCGRTGDYKLSDTDFSDGDYWIDLNCPCGLKGLLPMGGE